MNYVFVVPHFNHVDSLEKFLPRLSDSGLPCIIVDDGSDSQSIIHLKELLNQTPNFELVEHSTNKGKGAAMMSGAIKASQQGYSHMVQIDADGQHDVADLERFLADSRAHPNAIISGAPVFDDNAPKARVYGRRVTDFWVALETWSLSIKDSLCGFRVYPLAEFELVCRRFHIGRRMDVDTDLIVKSAWLEIPIRFIDTRVVYVENNASHFHYLRDNLRLIWLHFRLMLGMLIRAPFWIFRAGLRRLLSGARRGQKS